MVRDVFGVVPNAVNKRRSTAHKPRQPQEIDARNGTNATHMVWIAHLVEDIDIQPAEVGPVARCPKDVGYARLRQINPRNWIGDIVRYRPQFARVWFLGQVKPVGPNISVASIEKFQIYPCA